MTKKPSFGGDADYATDDHLKDAGTYLGLQKKLEKGLALTPEEQLEHDRLEPQFGIKESDIGKFARKL